MPNVALADLEVEHNHSGGGPGLLLLHSLLTDLSVFDGVLAPLAAMRRVTRINLPGFGRSSPVALESVAHHADHVALVMQALELQPDTAVFGNGFGAFVAAELAIRHSARFDRLILADAVAAFPEAARRTFRAMAEKVQAGGMEAVLDTAIGRMFPPAFAAANAPLVDVRKRALAMVDADCFARACLALAALDVRPRLGGLRNRTLVVCGALDQTTPPALARELAALIPGAVYREIPGAGHCPMLEQPEALVALMREFLA
jgi:3-oxoadipate enol-lactonase